MVNSMNMLFGCFINFVNNVTCNWNFRILGIWQFQFVIFLAQLRNWLEILVQRHSIQPRGNKVTTNLNGNKRICIISVGGKLTKFRSHKEITENLKSFYPQKFLAVLPYPGLRTEFINTLNLDIRIPHLKRHSSD